MVFMEAGAGGNARPGFVFQPNKTMQKITLELLAEKVLTVTANNGSAATVRRVAQSGSNTNYIVTELAAGASTIIGPFMGVREYAIEANGALPTYTITDPASGRDAVTKYPADGAIAISNGLAVITKGSAAAMTLAAPTLDEDGTILKVISATAFAHFVTAENLLINDGTSGGAKDMIEFPAYVGGAITLAAYGGEWYVMDGYSVGVSVTV